VYDGAGICLMSAKTKKKEASEGVETLSTLFGRIEIKPKPPEEQWETGVNLWTFVNSISEDKSYLFDEHTAKDYTPFTINRSFSIHIDTLHHASVMNQCYNLDKKMQHDYLFYSIPKKVRRKKWLKKTDDEKKESKILEDVANVIGYNFLKTKAFWKTLTESQRNEFLATYVYPNSKNEKQNAKINK
jgi:hypothetical protein